MHLPWKWYSVALLVVIVDHLTKWMATASLDYGQPVEVLPVFNLMLAHNTGAAFSFLADAGGWQRWFFVLLAVVVSLFIAVWLARVSASRLLASALALVLGGAIGNLIDRIWQGYVVDFISLHWGGWYFPAFNIADMGITAGAALLLLDMLINPHHHGSQPASDSGKAR